MKCKYKRVDLYCYQCMDQTCKLPEGIFGNTIYFKSRGEKVWTEGNYDFCSSQEFEHKREV